MGPLEILAPAWGMLALLTWFLASLENWLWKFWILSTDTQTDSFRSNEAKLFCL